MRTWDDVSFLQKMMNAKQVADQENEAGNLIMRQNIEELSVLPSKYYFPLATEYILEAVTTGRAENLKEAMLQTEEQIHRWNVEERHNTMIQQMKEINKQLQNIGIYVSRN